VITNKFIDPMGIIIMFEPSPTITVSGSFSLSLQESRELTEQRSKEREELLREHRKTDRELASKGKKPFYMKKCKRNFQSSQQLLGLRTLNLEHYMLA